jgi:hypothetical protein
MNTTAKEIKIKVYKSNGAFVDPYTITIAGIPGYAYMWSASHNANMPNGVLSFIGYERTNGKYNAANYRLVPIHEIPKGIMKVIPGLIKDMLADSGAFVI